jgi:anti-sigma regulatory factor (Ser/Thr protein kinase)
MPIKLPADVDTTPEDQNLYLGFSRQDLKFHQALGELIDNAISASQNINRFDVEIHIEKNKEEINVLVADSGLGISFDDLQKEILRIGGKGSRKGPLNEHGFGLKNALCVLTKNERPFHIITRDQQAKKQDIYLKVSGPFRMKPSMQIVEATEAEWSPDLLNIGDTGTRVFANTTMHYFRSAFRGKASFETLVERLLEHLGVMYRGYLHGTRSEIIVRWRDVSDKVVPWTDWKVTPIPIPFTKHQEEKLQVDYGGKSYSVIYSWGSLDSGEVEDSSKGLPYPLKLYYQSNELTQGIDIRVRGRVILPHQITYLWPDRQTHNSLNQFVGELIIDDPIFSTVNNKIELDPNNPVWEAVVDKLQDKKYKPADTVGAGKNEAEIRNLLLEKLKEVVSGSKTQANVPTWDKVGVEVDLIHTMSNGDEHIYELKAATAKPIDVYQLIMYWDARVEAGVRPKLARLVAKAENPHVVNLIEYWNHRKDKGGQPYRLEFKTVDKLVG